MEPRLPTPTPSPEMGNYSQKEMSKAPERAAHGEMVQAHPERQEVEVQAPTSGAVALPVTQITMPAPIQQGSVVSGQSKPLLDDTPLTANDDDLIEKEWVTKAKQIVQDTKSDPDKQKTEVSKLQADYLKKRYGKDVKLTNT